MRIDPKLWDALRDKALDTGKAHLNIICNPKNFQNVVTHFKNKKSRENPLLKARLGVLSFELDKEQRAVTVVLQSETDEVYLASGDCIPDDFVFDLPTLPDQEIL